MADSDGYLSRLQTIQKTRILPLRWIGNFLGGYAGNHLVKAFDLDEDEDFYEDFDDFATVDEEMLLAYLNEYYIVYPNKLPKSDLF